MSKYLRNRQRGGTYFFTVNLAQRGGTALVDNIQTLRGAFRDTIAEHPLHCDAIVVLPDHLHAVWTLPKGDANYSERWRKIKARFSNAVGARHRSLSKHTKRERGVWQRRFWEHTIRDQDDFQTHVQYCWADPVKHGFVKQPGEWEYSSIHRDQRMGTVAAGLHTFASNGKFST
ncbi:MAG: transposase [Paracoccaceae bacterium]